MDIQNPEAQNRELSGFWEKVIFLPFPHEKTTFQWPKVVSEAIFPTNRGYICIEKWSQIFVSGIGSAQTESEEKVILVSENDLFLTLGLGTSNARNENLRPLLNTNIPLISGNYVLRNHFWPLESCFLMRKNEKKSIFSKPPNLPILSFWILNLHIIICQFQKRSTKKHFFCLSPCSCH